MKFPKKANFMRRHIVPPPREDIDERAGVCRELQRTRFLWLSVLFFSEACERIADNRFDQSDFLVPQFLEFSFAPFFRQGSLVLADEHDQVFGKTVWHVDRIHDAADRFVVALQIVDLARQVVLDGVPDA
jgi:hypothetical protein